MPRQLDNDALQRELEEVIINAIIYVTIDVIKIM